MEKILSEDKKSFTNKLKTVYHASDGKKTLYATAPVTTTWHLHFVSLVNVFKKNIHILYSPKFESIIKRADIYTK